MFLLIGYLIIGLYTFYKLKNKYNEKDIFIKVEGSWKCHTCGNEWKNNNTFVNISNYDDYKKQSCLKCNNYGKLNTFKKIDNNYNKEDIVYIRKIGFWECLYCKHKWRSGKTLINEKSIGKKRLIDNEYIIQHCSICNSDGILIKYDSLKDYDVLSGPHRTDLCEACKNGKCKN